MNREEKERKEKEVEEKERGHRMKKKEERKKERVKEAKEDGRAIHTLVHKRNFSMLSSIRVAFNC